MTEQYFSQKKLQTMASDYNAAVYMISQITSKINTMALVVVKAVNATGVNPVGYVSVQPLVNQIDGAGIGYEHGVLTNIPFMRLQGGSNAVIIDPKVALLVLPQ